MADVMLAEDWNGQDPTGWWASEKMDGLRVLWKDGKLMTRGDREVPCPEDLRRALLPLGCVLDGELWCGQGTFQETVDAVLGPTASSEWPAKMRFMVFEARQAPVALNVESLTFKARSDIARQICREAKVEHRLSFVEHKEITSRAHFATLLDEVRRRGGEGLILRCVWSIYRMGRSSDMLKVKVYIDGEAIVDEIVPAADRSCQALKCRTAENVTFLIGSGLSASQRTKPPAVGTVITFRCSKISEGGVPFCAEMVGERKDMSWEHCLKNFVGHKSPRIPAGLMVGTGAPATSSAGASATTTAKPDGRFIRSSYPPSGLVADSTTAPHLPGASIAKRLLSMSDSEDEAPSKKRLEMMAPPPTTAGTSTSPPISRGSAAASASPPLPATAAAAATTTSSTAPATSPRPSKVCPYGEKCYRKNPAHFAEFDHPWLRDAAKEAEEEEERHRLAAAAAAEAAEAEATAAAAAAAAKKAKEEEEEEARARARAKAEEEEEELRAKEAEEAARRAKEESEAAALTASGSGGGAHASAHIAPVADVRAVAVRNLLQALSCNAPHGDERELFGRLLDQLDLELPTVRLAAEAANAAAAAAAPATGGSPDIANVTVAGVPGDSGTSSGSGRAEEGAGADADVEPPAHHHLHPSTHAAGREADRGTELPGDHPTGGAAASAASSVGPGCGGSAAAAEPARASSCEILTTLEEDNRPAAVHLRGMGFDRHLVTEALRITGAEVEPALEWLLTHSAASS